MASRRAFAVALPAAGGVPIVCDQGTEEHANRLGKEYSVSEIKQFISNNVLLLIVSRFAFVKELHSFRKRLTKMFSSVKRRVF